MSNDHPARGTGHDRDPPWCHRAGRLAHRLLLPGSRSGRLTFSQIRAPRQGLCAATTSRSLNQLVGPHYVDAGAVGQPRSAYEDMPVSAALRDPSRAREGKPDRRLVRRPARQPGPRPRLDERLIYG
jgi:hypothetical protein